MATALPTALKEAEIPGARHKDAVGYRRYLLCVLVVVGVFAWLDRSVLSVLLQSIKTELVLSDTQLGLLGGLAFGLFYAIVGLPVAWLADRYNRRTVLASSIALWSVMTAFCGLASSFLGLFLARVGVGVGEAGASPPAQSLVSDHFPAERRGFAFGILYLYVPLGFSLGFFSAGWLNEFLGWRSALVVLGLPGLLIAALVRTTLREPPRAASSRTPPLWMTVRYVCSRSSLRHLLFAGAIHGIGGFATAAWLPTYLIRTFDMSSGSAGTWLAVAYGFGGLIGVLAGGSFADQRKRMSRDDRWYAWTSASVVCVAAPLSALIYATHSSVLAIAALFAVVTLWQMFLGPVTAMLQGLAGVRRRAVVAALYLFLVNLVSSGAGPFAVGAASDYFGTSFGQDSLRLALLLVTPLACLWAALHFLLAARTLKHDLASVEGAALQE